jgi:hypothetical protein
MSFRGVQRWKPNYSAMMVKGGAVDGLADLAKAFVEAPIMRRKIELANKRQAAAEADAADSRQMRHEEHDATMALSRQKLAAGGKPTDIKPTQINGITQGIMAHARQAGTMKVGDGIETFDEATARKEYEHLRKLVPDSIRAQIPDYDGALSGATAEPAAHQDALDGATQGPPAPGADHPAASALGEITPGDGDGHDSEGLSDHDLDQAGAGLAAGDHRQGPMEPDEAAWNDAAMQEIENTVRGRKPTAGMRSGPRTRLDPGDLAMGLAGDDADPQKPIARARLAIQQGEIDQGRAAIAANGAVVQADPAADAKRAQQEDQAIATIVPALHPRDQAAYKRVLASGDPQRIAIARKRLLALAQPASSGGGDDQGMSDEDMAGIGGP